MSLQLAAQHLANKGRGDDKVLVHMSRKEVKSLNDLAMAHGGQLTINPETGLPEAGFLSAILPIVAGAALGPAGFGLASSAMGAGLMVGAGSYLLNPKAGLMGALSAGMGAYGGAGLGEALAQQGMQQATAEELAKSQAGISNVVGNAGTQGLPAGISPDQYAKNVLAQTQPYVDARTAAQTAFDAGSFTDKLGTIGQGAKTLTSPGGFSNLYTNLGGGMGTARTALAAAAPAMSMQPKDTSVAPVADKDMGQRYKYSPGVAQPLPSPDVPSYNAMLTQQDNFGRQQNYYPNQGYTPISNDEAKSMYGFAGGGPVEAMSNANAIGANTGFPQAYLHNNAYATPYQTPISQNVLTGAGDVSVDPYTGEQRMAAGGKAADKPENRDVDIYNDTGGPGAAGGNNTSSSPGTDNGSPTGSVLGDAGYAISNQSISPLAAAIASAIMDATSPTSNVSVNAVSGLDAQSDASTATGASSAAGVDGPAGVSSNGMGSDVSGDGGVGGSDGGGEARGGLSPRFTHHMADGGISGSGNLDLSIPLNFGNAGAGGFGGAGVNGYNAVGSGGGSQTPFVGQNNTGTNALGTTPFDSTYMDTFQPQGTGAFGGNPQQMIGLLSSLMQGQQSGNASAQQPMQMAFGGMATGGISDAGYNLGGYSDGGRLLRGPGDGVSDSIPAVIGKKQPARLADGEFVVPARIVSELGNGSTEAGARKLYAMMDRIQAARGKTVGKGRVAKNSRSEKYLPA